MAYREYPQSIPPNNPYDHTDGDHAAANNHHISNIHMAVNAYSINQGVGKEISAILNYINANNIGIPSKKIISGYIYAAGASGESEWWNGTNVVEYVYARQAYVNNYVPVNAIYRDVVVSGSNMFINGLLNGNSDLELWFSGYINNDNDYYINSSTAKVDLLTGTYYKFDFLGGTGDIYQNYEKTYLPSMTYNGKLQVDNLYIRSGIQTLFFKENFDEYSSISDLSKNGWVSNTDSTITFPAGYRGNSIKSVDTVGGQKLEIRKNFQNIDDISIRFKYKYFPTKHGMLDGCPSIFSDSTNIFRSHIDSNGEYLYFISGAYNTVFSLVSGWNDINVHANTRTQKLYFEINGTGVGPHDFTTSASYINGINFRSRPELVEELELDEIEVFTNSSGLYINAGTGIPGDVNSIVFDKQYGHTHTGTGNDGTKLTEFEINTSSGVWDLQTNKIIKDSDVIIDTYDQTIDQKWYQLGSYTDYQHIVHFKNMIFGVRPSGSLNTIERYDTEHTQLAPITEFSTSGYNISCRPNTIRNHLTFPGYDTSSNNGIIGFSHDGFNFKYTDTSVAGLRPEYIIDFKEKIYLVGTINDIPKIYYGHGLFDSSWTEYDGIRVPLLSGHLKNPVIYRNELYIYDALNNIYKINDFDQDLITILDSSTTAASGNYIHYKNKIVGTNSYYNYTKRDVNYWTDFEIKDTIIINNQFYCIEQDQIVYKILNNEKVTILDKNAPVLSTANNKLLEVINGKIYAVNNGLWYKNIDPNDIYVDHWNEEI